MGQFESLKTSSNKHGFSCKECHDFVHAYKPGEKNYEELIPLCATCHGEQNGLKKTDCVSCRLNSHVPVMMRLMVSGRIVLASTVKCHVLCVIKRTAVF